jgi:hypothetical protein
MQLAIDSGVSLSLWQNNNKRAKKRNEGMRLILVRPSDVRCRVVRLTIHQQKWSLDQIWANDPKIDWDKRCLSVYCRSNHRDGKGPIRPKFFQLQPIPKELQTPSEHKATYNEEDEIQLAIVQVYIDDLLQEARYIPLQVPPNPKLYLPQWPWILATVMKMQNHNAQLGKFRLDLLMPYVEALIRERKRDVLRFKAPPALGGQSGFVLYDFDKWQSIFGGVIDI